MSREVASVARDTPLPEVVRVIRNAESVAIHAWQRP
jgi:hypothetical protein